VRVAHTPSCSWLSRYDGSELLGVGCRDPAPALHRWGGAGVRSAGTNQDLALGIVTVSVPSLNLVCIPEAFTGPGRVRAFWKLLA
jgi:hypothetical protein